MTPTSEALTLAYACDWLKAVADASERGEVTLEMEMPDGRYLVALEWPSRLAYLEHARNLRALAAMLATSRLAA
jgi:hypothetical protein